MDAPRPGIGVSRDAGDWRARLWAWALRPDLLPAKLRRSWQRRRAEPLFAARLAAGDYLVEPPAAGPAPSLSVVLPVFRVAEAHLRAAIASVRAQSRREWELLLLDDASPDPHVRRILAEAVRDDRRVRALHREDNAGIARATDQLVAQSRGDFVAFLDHDDLLHPRALELAGRTLAARPEVDWLFTDEDKIDVGGRHREPCFKPGWSPHLLLAFNLVAHLRVVRRSLLDRLGGHRTGYEGAQDYDLALRAFASGAVFAHLPGVLYHWRSTRESMARGAAAKPAANSNALRALVECAAGFPAGGEVVADTLIGPASLFRVRRSAQPGLRIAALATPGVARGGRRLGAREISALPADPRLGDAAVVEAARRSDADVIVVAPPNLGPTVLEELLALLLVPGTAVAGVRLVRGRRVVGSGWRVDDRGGLYDPWSGLLRRDPGYLNLALVPGPRSAPPPIGWAGWRTDVVAAWDAAGPDRGAWRLAAGLLAQGRHVVVSPEAELGLETRLSAPGGHALRPNPDDRRRWVEDLGLEPRQARIPPKE